MAGTVRVAVTIGAALVLGAFGTPAAAGAAPVPVPEAATLAVPGAEVVPNSYIVVLKDGTGAVAGQARALAGRHDATVRTTYSHALRGFAATMSRAQARRLAADPAVAYVQPNVVHRVSDTQTNPPSYGLDRIDQRNRPLNSAYTYNTTASNVHAYIIDTGIRTTHSDFGGRATSGFDAIDGGTADDCHGHGTHVAGTVGGTAYGVAKGVQLVAVRVLNCEGSGTTEQVVAGIDWVTAQRGQAGRGEHEPRRRRGHRAGQRGTALDRVRRQLRDRGGQRVPRACSRWTPAPSRRPGSPRR